MRAIDGRALPVEGTYTVVGRADHRTLRFRQGEDGFFRGKTVISYLYGPDNERSYKGFAHIDETGTVRVWKAFREAADLIASVAFLANRDRQRPAGHAYALKSGRCYRCNRTLTVPTSIHRGLGPDCAAMTA